MIYIENIANAQLRATKDHGKKVLPCILLGEEKMERREEWSAA